MKAAKNEVVWEMSIMSIEHYCLDPPIDEIRRLTVIAIAKQQDKGREHCKSATESLKEWLKLKDC